MIRDNKSVTFDILVKRIRPGYSLCIFAVCITRSNVDPSD